MWGLNEGVNSRDALDIPEENLNKISQLFTQGTKKFRKDRKRFLVFQVWVMRRTGAP